MYISQFACLCTLQPSPLHTPSGDMDIHNNIFWDNNTYKK